MKTEFTTLLSLAILKVDLDGKTRDYLDYFEDFALYVLGPHGSDPVTDELLSDLLLKEFGLKLPNRACQLILRRLARKGFLEKQHNIFTITKELPKRDFSSKRESAKHHIELVYSRLNKYANDHFGLGWSDSEITRAILAFLGNFGIEFLRAYIFKTALPEISASAPKEQFVVSKFIKELYDEADPLFDSVLVLVKGQMYANALVCPDLESISKKFDNLTFYIDTPLILNLLGLQAPEDKAAMNELVQLLRQLRGKLAVFDHTFEEIQGVLLATEKNLDDPRAVGNVIRVARNRGMTRSDLILMREKLEDNLRSYKISIMPTPRYKAALQISEQELDDAISGEIAYKSKQALRFDINSVRSIYVLREGKIPVRLEDSIAVFVTANTLLAKAAFIVGQQHNSTREVSSTITDYSLANVAWLKAPMGAPELPTKEMLAACYAAIEPSHILWTKYVEEVDNLQKAGTISADDHAILRVSPLAADELMNLTMGDETALTGASIGTILSRVKQELVREKDQEIERERSVSQSLKSHVHTLEEDKELTTARLFWISSKIATILSFCSVMVFVVLLIIGGFGMSLITNQFIVSSIMLTSFAYFVILLTISWSILNWYLGITIQQVMFKVEDKMQQRVFAFLSKFLHI